MADFKAELKELQDNYNEVFFAERDSEIAKAKYMVICRQSFALLKRVLQALEEPEDPEGPCDYAFVGDEGIK